MAVRLPQDVMRRGEAVYRTCSLVPPRHPGREHSVIRCNKKIDARALETDHVAAHLFAHEVACSLVFELSETRPSREELRAIHLRPRLPADIGQNLGGVVVTPVPFPHQELDEPAIGVIQVLLAAPEADTRAV